MAGSVGDLETPGCGILNEESRKAGRGLEKERWLGIVLGYGGEEGGEERGEAF